MVEWSSVHGCCSVKKSLSGHFHLVLSPIQTRAVHITINSPSVNVIHSAEGVQERTPRPFYQYRQPTILPFHYPTLASSALVLRDQLNMGHSDILTDGPQSPPPVNELPLYPMPNSVKKWALEQVP